MKQEIDFVPGVKCPKCNETEHKTADTRPYKNGVRRRKICKSCRYRFYTIEKCETEK